MAKEKKVKKEKVKKIKTKNKKRFKIFRKIVKFIYNILAFIYNLIDKFIVTPIAKLILWVQKQLEGSGKIFDRLLNNKVILITIALLISIGSIFAIYKHNDLVANNSEDVVSSQKIKALYNKEAYVIEGLPETVDITLIGSTTSKYLAKQSMDKEITVDLRKLKPGNHKVQIKYNGSKISNVSYKVDPSEVTVIVYEKMSESKTIVKEILNENKLNSKYTISSIKFSRDEVYVTGAEYKLKQIATVKALVDVSKITDPEVGTKTLKEVPLFAYDENGEKLDLEIVPATLDATIEIKSPSKEVSLRAIPQGNVVFGKAIESITLSKTTATIYGEQSALDKVSSIPVNINVEGLSKNNEYTVNISLPSGIKEISTKSVTAKVVLADITEKTIDDVSITTKNLASGLTAQAASKDDSVCSVIVKGTSSNIKNISSENITASVDLQGLGKGTHKVKVVVSGDDTKLTYTPKTETVTIVIK